MQPLHALSAMPSTESFSVMSSFIPNNIIQNRFVPSFPSCRDNQTPSRKNPPSFKTPATPASTDERGEIELSSVADELDRLVF